MSMAQMQDAQEDSDDGTWIERIAQELSGVTVIIIIAGGILTFVLLFIFAKRQIMRFALRSHRGPHATIGMEANKSLRKEILRRIEAIPKIMYEPQALREETDIINLADGSVAKVRPSHFYRMKALDDTKVLEQNIVKRKLGKRQCFESLRSFFIFVFTPGVDPRIVHQFCDSYEAARFRPKPFNEEEYQVFGDLLKQLGSSLGTLHPKSSSIRSPGKSSGTSSTSSKSGPPLTTDTTMDMTQQSGTTYVRRLTKEKRNKWAQQKHSKDSEEEHCLTDAIALHEISIIPGAKDESTIL